MLNAPHEEPQHLLGMPLRQFGHERLSPVTGELAYAHQLVEEQIEIVIGQTLDGKFSC